MADEPATQSISDDQELAKVLAGVSQDAEQAASVPEPPVVAAPEPVIPEPAVVAPEPAAPAASGELDGIKLEAINELRPLVDKLNLSPEEKFDTYLLLLRSTDDKELIGPAHDTAKLIADETRRAQALLDIIKEIDFLSQSQKA